MTTTRSLVTGGAGFLGAALARRLVALGHRVRIVDDLSRGRAHRLDGVPGAEFVRGDLTDPNVAREAARDIDVVWHLAAVNGTRNFYEHPDRVLEVGIAATLNTVRAAVEGGARRYVFASSSEVYQQPPVCPTPENVPCVVPDVHNPRYSYGGSKIAGELMALHLARPRGLEAVVVRPHNIYGPDMGTDHVIPALCAHLDAGRRGAARPIVVPIQGTGRETRAFCYIDDAAAGIATAGTDGPDGAVFNVGTRDEIPIADLVGTMGEVLGESVVLVPGTAPAGATSRRCPDTTALRALGWQPVVPLRDGLRRTMAWYLDDATD